MRDERKVFWEGLRRTLGAAADLLLLNLLTILCCAPVVTTGAAWVAGYQHMLRIVRWEETGFPLRSFFSDFRKAFRQATAAWLLQLACFALLAGDYYYAVHLSVPVNRFFLVFSIAMAVVLFSASVWLFPLMARYENTLRGHVKNAFLMAAALLPKTFLALAVQLAFLAPPLFFPDILIYLGWFWVLFGFSLPMYLTAKIFRKPLASDKKPDEDGQD
jgi:uncharacterized membrane protein YesL